MGELKSSGCWRFGVVFFLPAQPSLPKGALTRFAVIVRCPSNACDFVTFSRRHGETVPAHRFPGHETFAVEPSNA